jgi:hypothetical protein
MDSMTVTNTTSQADPPGVDGDLSEKMIAATTAAAATTPTCSAADDNNDVSPSRTASPPVFTFVDDQPTTRGELIIDEVHPFSKAITTTDNHDNNTNNNEDDENDDGLFLDQTISTEIKQKIAMDKFLAAQLISDNTSAKEDAWRELVQLMKQQQRGGGDARSMSASSNVSAGSGGSSRNNNNRRIPKNIGRPPRRNSSNSLGIGRIKGGVGSKDDVLGTICIASSSRSAMENNVGSSTHSSLTANTTTDSDNHYLDVTLEDTTTTDVEGGGKEQDGEETTPPTALLPILSTSGIKVEKSPMVSPLSLGGSFDNDVDDDDDDDVLIRPVNIMIGEQHYHPLAAATTTVAAGTTTNKISQSSSLPPPTADATALVSSPMLKRRDQSVITSSSNEEKKEKSLPSSSSIAKKKNPNIFFDIRKPFADNYSLRSTEDDNQPIINNIVKSISLADSISEDNTSSAAHHPSLDATFTTSRVTDAIGTTDSYTTSTLDSNNNCSNVNNGGAVILSSTDATKYYFTALLGDKKPKEEVVLSQQHHHPCTTTTTQHKLLDTKSRSASFVAQSYDGEVITFEEMVNDSSSTKKKETIEEVTKQQQKQQRSTPIDLENLISTSSDQHRSPRRRTKLHRRGGNNNNNNSLPSLEDQIRNVLQKQQQQTQSCDNVRNDEEGGPNKDEVVNEKSLGLLDKSTSVGGSTTSAQEILMELRNSTTTTTRSSTPLCSLVIGSLDAPPPPPLGIISIGGRSKHQSQKSSPSEKLPMTNSADEAPSSHNTAHLLPALAPSRLDLPRPNRIYRKCISEPHPKSSAAATGMFSVGDISMTVKPSVSQRELNPLLSTTGADDVIKQDSPFERYRKAIGMKQQDSASVKINRPRGMFPKTYPQPSSALPEEELNSTNNPFCSPSRTNNLRDDEFPFEEQSSPISFTPDDASAVPHDVTVSLEDTSGLCISDTSENNAVASQMNVNVPTPSPVTSQDLPPITLLLAPSKRDTRRACVLPSESIESELIRSTISKSKIIDADDGVSLPASAEVVEISNNSPVQPQPWNVMNEIMNETVLDDDAVEEAVWAATHSFSTTSTMDGMQNNDDEEEEQSVFVVKRPENLEWESKWTAFVTSSIDDDDFNTNEWDEDDDQWEDCNKCESWERREDIVEKTISSACRKVIL